LRQNSRLQKCFQIVHDCCGKPRYIEAEKVYSYEHNSAFKVSDNTRSRLLHEIDEDEFYPEPIENRLMLDEVESFFKSNKVSLDQVSSIEDLARHLRHGCYNVETVMKDLVNFCRIAPRLPSTDKKWLPSPAIEIDKAWPREQIVDYLSSLRSTSDVADLAFMAFRDMKCSPWKPFMKAALQRNPVSIAGSANLDLGDAARRLSAMTDESIYDATRMAQPDEVWNFCRGDGLEKAICLLNIVRSRQPHGKSGLKGDGKKVIVFDLKNEYEFITRFIRFSFFTLLRCFC
jgi:hypothetical protein